MLTFASLEFKKACFDKCHSSTKCTILPILKRAVISRSHNVKSPIFVQNVDVDIKEFYYFKLF